MESRFETALQVGKILAGLGWIAVFIGVLVFVVSFTETGLTGEGVALLIILIGLFDVAAAQLVQATIATANNTKDILEELRLQRR